MKTIVEASWKVPLHVWADRVDRLSLRQLERLARWDRLTGPIAVMPDIHYAETVCVGTVLATEACVLPTAIGQDLGCGMRTARFEAGAAEFSRADLERLVELMMTRIPSGRRTHREPQELPEPLRSAPLSTRALEHARAYLGARHFGTLGEGNHFVELQSGAEGRLYATVHSGSRGVGAAIAAHHGRVALGRKQRGDPLPSLDLGTLEARQFFDDLNWAVAFATENRARMMGEVCGALREFTGRDTASEMLFDVAHNVISFENFLERPCVIHRKGAMPAGAGSLGIVPGSMGTASYLVEGLGHAASYASCSHGAGRQMSRGDARRRISVRDLRREMAAVVYPPGMDLERALVEEAPGAYKDIRAVLDQQRDLIRPVLRLSPLAVLKG